MTSLHFILHFQNFLSFSKLFPFIHSSPLSTSIYCLFTHSRIWFYMTSKYILLNPAGPSNTVFHQLFWAYVQILEVLQQCLTPSHSSEPLLVLRCVAFYVYQAGLEVIYIHFCLPRAGINGASMSGFRAPYKPIPVGTRIGKNKQSNKKTLSLTLPCYN